MYKVIVGHPVFWGLRFNRVVDQLTSKPFLYADAKYVLRAPISTPEAFMSSFPSPSSPAAPSSTKDRTSDTPAAGERLTKSSDSNE